MRRTLVGILLCVVHSCSVSCSTHGRNVGPSNDSSLSIDYSSKHTFDNSAMKQPVDPDCPKYPIKWFVFEYDDSYNTYGAGLAYPACYNNSDIAEIYKHSIFFRTALERNWLQYTLFPENTYEFPEQTPIAAVVKIRRAGYHKDIPDYMNTFDPIKTSCSWIVFAAKGTDGSSGFLVPDLSSGVKNLEFYQLAVYFRSKEHFRQIIELSGHNHFSRNRTVKPLPEAVSDINSQTFFGNRY